MQGLPFMPQMFKYCGRRFQVYERAHNGQPRCQPADSPMVFISACDVTAKPIVAAKPPA
jgi:hypothetical protein